MSLGHLVERDRRVPEAVRLRLAASLDVDPIPERDSAHLALSLRLRDDYVTRIGVLLVRYGAQHPARL